MMKKEETSSFMGRKFLKAKPYKERTDFLRVNKCIFMLDDVIMRTYINHPHSNGATFL